MLDPTYLRILYIHATLNIIVYFYVKQDSKELSPRPLENALKTFNSKFFLLMLKGSLTF